MNPAIQGLVTIFVGVFGCIGYFYASNLLLDKVIFPAKGPNIGRNINRATAIRPWLFLFPAVFAMGVYLAYPVVGSFIRSLFNRQGDAFIGFGNYASLLGDSEFRTSVFNNFELDPGGHGTAYA